MRILLAGYYGFGNLGDDLLCRTAQDILQTKHQVRLFSRCSRALPVAIRNLLWSEVLLFGGGSVFQDASGRGLTVLYYAFWIFLAKALRKKVFLVAQGIGPIKRSLSKFVIKQVLRKADYISVRNRESAAFVGALGIKNCKLFNDLLFAQPRMKKTIRGPIISVSLRKEYTSPELLAVLKLLEKEHDLIYVVMQEQDLQPGPILVLHKALEQSKLAVGMRLHFLLEAARYNIPFVGISYDPKVEGFCRQMGMPFISLDKASSLPELIRTELAKSSYRKPQLKANVVSAEKIAADSVRDLQEALDA